MSILLGCTVAVISSAVQSLGVTLQRKLYAHEPHYHHSNQKHRRNLWLAGFAMFISANILGLAVQISTLPLIILLPLQSIGLIFNSVLSCVLLDEHFTHRLGYGTLSIAIGAFVIAYNGATPTDPPGGSIDDRFADVWARLLAPAFVSWFAGTLLFCVAMQVCASRLRRSIARGFCYGIISGTLTAHTFLFAKSLVDVVVATIVAGGTSGLLRHKTAYALLAAMLGLIALQLSAFNMGLKQMLTSILYPLCFLVYNIFNLVNDLIFNSLLAEHKMSIAQFAWVVVGLVAVLAGVVTISWDAAFEEEEPKTPKRVLSFEQSQLLSSLNEGYGT